MTEVHLLYCLFCVLDGSNTLGGSNIFVV